MNNILQILKRGEVRRSIARWIKESPYLKYIRLAQPETRIWGREPGTLPSFLIIGAQRSGSTFLHDVLAHQTSAQESPLQKEVHYFDNKYYRSLDWYSKFFDPLNNEGDPRKKTYEASPYYLYHPAVPKRVKECLPEITVIAVLRDPVARAISQYKWIRQVGLEPRGAVEAFQYDAERLDWEREPEYLKQFDNPLYFDFDHIHYGYLRRSLYDVQLRRWLTYFEPSNIRVINSSRLFKNPEQIVDELVGVLNLDRAGRGNGKSINRNSSRSDIKIPAEARKIARRHLEGVEDNLRTVLTEEMLLEKMSPNEWSWKSEWVK